MALESEVPVMTTTRLASLPLIATLVLVAIAGAAPASAQSHPPASNRPFVGAWHLAWLEQPGPDGKLHRITCCGQFLFTADGHLSVQVIDRSAQQAPAASPNQYSQGGYEASWGTYVVDPQAHTFTFHLEGALVRSLIGQDLPRRYQFSGNQLIVSSTNPAEHWRVAWQRD